MRSISMFPLVLYVLAPNHLGFALHYFTGFNTTWEFLAHNDRREDQIKKPISSRKLYKGKALVSNHSFLF